MKDIELILLLIAMYSLIIFSIIVSIRDFLGKKKRNSFEYNHEEILPENILATGTTSGAYIGTFSYIIFTRPGKDELFLYTGGDRPTEKNGKQYLCIYYVTSLHCSVGELSSITSERIERSGYNTYMNAAR